MSADAITPASATQANALVEEVERQFSDEAEAILAAARREADAVVAQARGGARARLREAIKRLRREGAARLARAEARRETEVRAAALRAGEAAIEKALPLLREALEARWRDNEQRRQWVYAVAHVCATRMRPGALTVEHPANWAEAERAAFVAAMAPMRGVEIHFHVEPAISAGLRIVAAGATLDATPRGLLYDERAIAALLLNEIGHE